MTSEYRTISPVPSTGDGGAPIDSREPAVNGAPAREGDQRGFAPATDANLWRRQIRHDIHHELATIMMLASAVAVSDDVGPESRTRIEQLLGETRWLDQLLRRLDEDVVPDQVGPITERLGVDTLVGEVVDAIKLSRSTRVAYESIPAWAHVDRLAMWRALRNVMDNACRVAGPGGQVTVRVFSERGWTIVQVDDDGPGFGFGSRGMASLGLGIVHEFVSAHGGSLEMRQSELGGACVRIVLPAAPPPAAA
ncbi:sensor histidine kinase [Bailinhaonella thermotolerans]|uniref:histidine kinase n=1 Tax=Bailinhaonella thermotolerans TaxID=1070861 RepID=A0A3A4BHX2_9ACTN|nr:ATP-binding protein [Bailinhaonella thermotolerans]RJL30862.1 hypothetical protein D5H75_21405 [Bailinhaonella thermotolerans]